MFEAVLFYYLRTVSETHGGDYLIGMFETYLRSTMRKVLIGQYLLGMKQRIVM